MADSPSVFVLSADNNLTELSRSDYQSEEFFQELLEKHPALIAHATGDAGRLLLVQREASIPDTDGGAGRWALDHLFLDAEGVPVLVEVKRSRDPRARREVVAQMLDYAANGVAYWPLEHLISSFERTAQATGAEPSEVLGSFLKGMDAEQFWRGVDANLRSGRIRLLFVADRIPPELRRIVEFLNEQMRPAEVLAIEIEQFVGSGGLRMLAPRVLGATARAVSAKSVQPIRSPISEDDWLQTLADLKGPQVRGFARKLAAWFRDNGYAIEVTKSQDSLAARLTRPDGKPSWPFFIRRSTGRVEAALGIMKHYPALASDAARQVILDRLRALPGQNISTANLNGSPSFLIASLSDPAVWDAFTGVARHVREQYAALLDDAPSPTPTD